MLALDQRDGTPGPGEGSRQWTTSLPGTDPDTIGITLWAGNRLVLSSRWSGWSTLEQQLAGGRIDVR